jgi:hypothetical protein
MGKMDARTGRSRGESKHVRNYAWMLNAPAYRSLSCYARCLLDEIKLRHDGSNNGDIPMSAREAATALNCSQPTALKAFRDLEDRRFIRANIKGHFDRKTRDATTWILEEFPYRSELATKGFMRWEPPSKAEHA